MSAYTTETNRYPGTACMGSGSVATEHGCRCPVCGRRFATLRKDLSVPRHQPPAGGGWRGADAWSGRL